MHRELRQAARALVHSPAFTTVVVVTLALGIGVNTAIFSVLYGVLFRPLPYRDPERVVTVWESNPQLGIAQDQVAAGTYVDFRDRVASLESMAAYQLGGRVLTDFEEPERIDSAQVSPELFAVLGAEAEIGRTFAAAEEQEGFERLVLLSHRLWVRRFAADPAILDTVIRFDDEPFVVIGVMPEGFEFPPDQEQVEAWTPLTVDPRLVNVRGMRTYNVVGRLSENVSLGQARQELDSLAREIGERFPDSNRGWSTSVVPAHEQLVGDIGATLWVLSAAAVLVLLIACANIGNLLLVRSFERGREYAIRAALGAGRRFLVRHSLAESLLLAAAGGALGLLLAFWGVDLLRTLIPGNVPRMRAVGIDLAALAFTLVAAMLSGLLAGLVPAFRAMQPDLTEVLQEGGRGRTGSRGSRRAVNLMVTAEVGLALMLLVGAGLLIRSFDRLTSVDPGFRVDGVVSVALSLPQAKYRDPGSQRAFYNELVDRVAGLPGVEAAGAVSSLPMSPVGLDFDLPFQIEGRPVMLQTEQPRADYRSVIPGYFEALAIPLRRGRLIDSYDRQENHPAMVINETMARVHFPGEDPLGKFLGVPMAGSIEIVGVVGDVRHRGLGAEARPEMFVSYQQFALREMHLVVHTRRSAGVVVGAIREQIRALDPLLPIYRVATMPELVSSSLAQPRFNMVLLGALATCAMVLAAVGIYGVISYSVASRASEIGIRMALGADAAATRRMVVSRALGFVSGGVALGVLGALTIGRLMAGLLYGVAPGDPLTLVTVSAVLVGVAAVAAALPARRATRVDPIATLRRE